MRKPEDIKKFMEKFSKEDFFGVIRQDCISCLPYETASEYLSEEETANAWNRRYAECLNIKPK